jgi:hypothetical protein
MLLKRDLLRRINLIPPVQSRSQKYSVSCLTQIKSTFTLSRPTEGRLAIVTNAGRDAMDAAAPLTNGAEADGEVGWSRRPDAGVKFRGAIHGMMVANKPGHQGEHEGNR